MGRGRDPALDLLEREGGHRVGVEGDGGLHSIILIGHWGGLRSLKKLGSVDDQTWRNMEEEPERQAFLYH